MLLKYFLDQSNFYSAHKLKIVIGMLPLVLVVLLVVALLVVSVKRKVYCRSKKNVPQVRQEERSCTRAEMSGANLPYEERFEYKPPKATPCLIIPISAESLQQVLSSTPKMSSSSASQSSSSIQIIQPNPFPQGTSPSAQQAAGMNAAAVNRDGSIPNAQPSPNPNLCQQRTQKNTSSKNVIEERRNLLGGPFSISPANNHDDSD